MKEELIIEQLRELRYPGTIDVTSAVMDQVRNKPLLVRTSAPSKARRITISIAACLICAIGINVALLFLRSYDNVQIGNAIAEVYDFNADYAASNSSIDFGDLSFLYE